MLDYVSSESPHKNLHIRITVLFERIGDFIQSVCNLRFGFFDFYRFVLYFYHQISHMAELCHINIKRRLRRHIFSRIRFCRKSFALLTILRNRLGSQPLENMGVYTVNI